MVRLCIVGCGRIARRHIESIQKLPSVVRLAGMADLDPARARMYKEEFHADIAFEAPAEAAASDRIDAALVCLPHDALTEVSSLFLRHGKHVLIEKPMGVSVPQLAEAVKLAQEKSLVFQPGYVCRFMQPFIQLKKRLDAGELGEISHIVSIQHGHIPEPATPWWALQQKAGGFYLPIFTSHMVDRILWLTGRLPARVFGKVWSGSPVFEGESDGTASLLFPGGLEATLNFSATTPGGGSRLECIAASKGCAECSYEILKINGKSIEHAQTDPFALQLEEFAAAIIEGRRSSPDAPEGLRVLEILRAIQTSSRSDAPVCLKEFA